MSKELPYWKFIINDWDNGNIHMCSNESKGLFIDVCSMYWARLGELPYKLALQKICNGNASALEELMHEEIIIIDSMNNIVIEFLDEQLEEFQAMSEKRAKAANKRWKNASALQEDSKSNAKRGEEKRREEKKEDNYIPDFHEFLEYASSSKSWHPSFKDQLNLKYESWKANNWHDGNGKKIKNWKSKILNTMAYFKKTESENQLFHEGTNIPKTKLTF